METDDVSGAFSRPQLLKTGCDLRCDLRFVSRTAEMRPPAYDKRRIVGVWSFARVDVRFHRRGCALGRAIHTGRVARGGAQGTRVDSDQG